jgi:hypothetical protein
MKRRNIGIYVDIELTITPYTASYVLVSHEFSLFTSLNMQTFAGAALENAARLYCLYTVQEMLVNWPVIRTKLDSSPGAKIPVNGKI